jgi:hypothetical protein
MSTITTYPLSTDEAIALECEIRELELRIDPLARARALHDAMDIAESYEIEHLYAYLGWKDFITEIGVDNIHATQPRLNDVWDI